MKPLKGVPHPGGIGEFERFLLEWVNNSPVGQRVERHQSTRVLWVAFHALRRQRDLLILDGQWDMARGINRAMRDLLYLKPYAICREAPMWLAYHDSFEELAVRRAMPALGAHDDAARIQGESFGTRINYSAAARPIMMVALAPGTADPNGA